MEHLGRRASLMEVTVLQVLEPTSVVGRKKINGVSAIDVHLMFVDVAKCRLRDVPRPALHAYDNEPQSAEDLEARAICRSGFVCREAVALTIRLGR